MTSRLTHGNTSKVFFADPEDGMTMSVIRWDDDSSEMMMTVTFFPETKEKIVLLKHIQIMRRQYSHFLNEE